MALSFTYTRMDRYMAQLLVNILNALSKVIGWLYGYRTVYGITGFFATRRFPKARNLHKYAALIAARNEETVIGNLIESIRQQDYPQELVDIFVVADNCTDRTAEVARTQGAVCYTRRDPDHRTKGYALQYLVEHIRKDYGLDAFEGYFIFDADNLLKRDFISKMNDAFDAGEKIVTAYRNTKNFDDNWISASYGIHWLRTIRSEHRARSLFHLATRIQGTGFLFAWEVIREGWNYTSLTEDRAFCADAVVNGYQISYQNEAEFYDEQPVDLRIALRQRIRWAKGHLQAFIETGGKLFGHIFLTHGAANRTGEVSGGKRLLNNLRLRFMSFDMLTVVYPRSLLRFLKKIAVYILQLVMIFTTGYGFVTTGLAPAAAEYLLGFLGIDVLARSGFDAAVLLTSFTLAWSLDTYFKGVLSAAYVFLVERKRIMPIKWYRKLWFCLTFPLFDFIGKIASCIALFTKVEWKPIPHNANVSIAQLDKKHRRG